MTKTKAQLRAEAVERLETTPCAWTSDYISAMLGFKVNAGVDRHELRDALIDLLIDDDDCDIECYCCSKLAELMAENSQLRVKVDEQWDSNVTCPDGNGTASDDCGQIADMSQMSADCVRSEPGMSEVDSRDNGWYLRYDGYMTSKSNYLRISGFKAARALDNRQNLVFVKFMGGKEADCRVYAPKLDVCENLHDSSKETQKPRSREADSGNVSDSDGENLHVEHDTREKPWHERVDDYLATFDDGREKLEADITRQFSKWFDNSPYPSQGHRIAVDWLDRQAAITSLEWCHSNEQLEIENTALRAKVDEAKSENDAMYARINELYKEADKTEAERDYWKAQVRTCLNSACMHNGHAVYSEGVMDYPREDGCCEPSLLVTAEVDHLRDFYADERRKSKRLEGEAKTQRNNFDQATGARDYWKEKLGILLQRLRDLGCEVGGINDVPIDVKLPEVVE